MTKAKTQYAATTRGGASNLIVDTSLWEVLRFVAFWFKSGSDHDSITIYKKK